MLAIGPVCPGSSSVDRACGHRGGRGRRDGWPRGEGRPEQETGRDSGRRQPDRRENKSDRGTHGVRESESGHRESPRTRGRQTQRQREAETHREIGREGQQFLVQVRKWRAPRFPGSESAPLSAEALLPSGAGGRTGAWGLAFPHAPHVKERVSLGGTGEGLPGWQAWGAEAMTGQEWGFIEHLLWVDAFWTLPLSTLHQMSGGGPFTLHLAAEAPRANLRWTQEPGANHWYARPSEGSLLSSWLCPTHPCPPSIPAAALHPDEVVEQSQCASR